MEKLTKLQLDKAAQYLKDGGIIAFPTETVFGLGVVYDNRAAYERLISVKRRPPEKPFTLMLSNPKDISKYAYIDKKSGLLIEKFMPGQFTIILKAKDNLPSFVVSKEGNVGIRIPDDKLIRDLIDKVGKPLLVPSANRSGEPPLTNDVDVYNEFKDDVDAVIEGKSISNTPSTIVMVTDKIEIIREGLIKKEDIDKGLEEFL